MVPLTHEPLDELVLITTALLCLVVGCCCAFRVLVIKCMTTCRHRRRKVANAQKEPLMINRDNVNSSDTMQKLLRTQSTRHLESRFAAEGKDILPEMDKSTNRKYDKSGWMNTEEAYQGSSPLSPLSRLRYANSFKTYFFKFSHERHRLWYHEKETSVVCIGFVEMENVISVEIKKGTKSMENENETGFGFGFELRVNSENDQHDVRYSFWCKTKEDRDQWVSVIRQCIMERIGFVESPEGQSNDEMVSSQFEYAVMTVHVDELVDDVDVVPIPYSEGTGI